MKLENKVAIITGANTGIGFAVSEAYIREGAKIVLTGTTIEGAEEAKNKILTKYPNGDILALKVDVTKTDDVINMVERTIEKYNGIDILVNNAGVALTRSILEMTDEEYEYVMNVNAFGTVRCIREVAKYMKNNGGSIINTSSMVGLYGGIYQTAYTASKYAINGITETCAKELGQYKIRVNAVAPGIIQTDMVKEQVTEEVKTKLIHMAPLGRVGTPEDLQGIYVYLASDESLYTTGSIISVDGGLIM